MTTLRDLTGMSGMVVGVSDLYGNAWDPHPARELAEWPEDWLGEEITTQKDDEFVYIWHRSNSGRSPDLVIVLNEDDPARAEEKAWAAVRGM